MSEDEPPVPENTGGFSNLTAPRFKAGESGNPGGRPKDLPEFRAACRELTWASLDVIRVGLKDAEVSFGDKITAFKALADRGGFLPVDRQAAVEAGQARLLLAMTALEVLTPPERKKLLDAMERGLAAEVMGVP